MDMLFVFGFWNSVSCDVHFRGVCVCVHLCAAAAPLSAQACSIFNTADD